MVITTDEIVNINIRDINPRRKSTKRLHDPVPYLVVKPDPDEPWSYVVVDGDKRLAYAKKSGITSVPCKVLHW